MRDKNPSGFQIMKNLIGLVKPLIFVMFLGILLGTVGSLCAIFVTVIGAEGLAMALLSPTNPMLLKSMPKILSTLLAVAVLRGLLHYGEQYCNHYIAFRILAIIRNKVFNKLRELCPAKLERKEKGNLIALITADIELLEVFFAHTISPIAIAVLSSLFMSIFIGVHYLPAGIIAAIAYVTVGGMIPASNEINTEKAGLKYRNKFGTMNSFILGAIYGVDDTIQFGRQEKAVTELNDLSEDLAGVRATLIKHEKSQRLLTNFSIQAFSLIMLGVMLFAYNNGRVNFEQVMIVTVAMMSSFGPVVALASLSNTLNQTLACGNRILSLFGEEPVVDEVTEGVEFEMVESVKGNIASVNNVSFSYGNVEALKRKSLSVPGNKILGIHGPSGSGKSTLLHLLMRFWDTDEGQIYYYDKEEGPVTVDFINTDSLRETQSLVSQETWISHDTIANNIAIAKPGASMEEIVKAAKCASIHDFIAGLSHGYDTVIGEDGCTLSEGEKQRIGLARAFLREGNLMLLDEPTSSLDAINEGMILKSIKEQANEKTVVLVSHRKSTMGIADSVVEF